MASSFEEYAADPLVAATLKRFPGAEIVSVKRQGETVMASDEKITVQVCSPHFTAGIVLCGDKVIEAAPILAWTIGKSRDWLRDYFRGKGWQVRAFRAK